MHGNAVSGTEKGLNASPSPVEYGATPRRKPADGKGRMRGGHGPGGPAGWVLLAGCVAVTAAYIAFLYFFFVGPLSFRWRALFGEPDYPKGYNVRGIDISHYQKDIQWDILRRATVNGYPLAFVIVKATEGASLVDEDFADNFLRARSDSTVRGAYHFFIPDCSPEEQAAFYIRHVRLEAGDLPPIIDIERRGEKPLADFQSDVMTWLAIVRETYGVAPIIYTSLKFKRKHLSDTVFDDFPLWIANYYKEELKYDGAWTLWQYTDLGKVEGIDHNVDFNLFNGSTGDFCDLLIPECDSLLCG